MQMVADGGGRGEGPHRCQQGGELRPEGDALGQHLVGVVCAQLLSLPRPRKRPRLLLLRDPPEQLRLNHGQDSG